MRLGVLFKMSTPRQYLKKNTDLDTPRTPQESLSFSRELRHVLKERNLLTAKTRETVCSMLSSVSDNSEEYKLNNFRRQAIEEIISSEKTYLSQLQILMEFFVRPLKEMKILTDVQHTSLFGQIEMIYNLNGELLREVTENMDNVAHAFLKMAPFLKLYSVYAFDYRNSLLMMQELINKNSAFRKFIEDRETRPEVQRKLNSLMIAPIQRVPRYKLLLEQILFYTSPAASDFKALKASIKEIANTASHINACVEDQEVTQMLLNMQNSLINRTPHIVQPSRKVVKEGVLNKITRKGTEIKRYCVLMSDIFMYCKILKDRSPNTVVENSLECCCIFPLKKCKVYELFPGNFKLTCHGDGIIFGSTDLQVQRNWVRCLRDAVDSHIECRKTLRKESSKRMPIRRKDIKNFDTNDVKNSTHRKKGDYDRIYRNRSSNTDSENESGADSLGLLCFSRNNNQSKNDRKAKKRQAPCLDNSKASTSITTINIGKLGLSDVKDTRGILKNSSLSLAQANINYDTISNFGGVNTYLDAYASNTISPYRQYEKENANEDMLPQLKKRVKFEEVQNQTQLGFASSPTGFIGLRQVTRNSWGDRIWGFIANLIP